MMRIWIIALAVLLMGPAVACGGTDSERTQSTAPAPATTVATRQAAGTAATMTTAPTTATRTVTATGTPAGGPAGTNAIDPCRLASKQEVEAAAGFTVADGRLQRSAVDVCIYEEPAGSRVVRGRVYLYAMRSSAAGAIYDEARKNEYQPSDVAGLGDRAFHGTAGTLIAIKGDVFIQLDVDNPPSGSSEAERREKRVALVRAIFGRV